MKRTNEFLFTLVGVFTGAFYGTIGLQKFLLHINGTCVLIPTAAISAVAFGLIFNKIGSEIDRRRFFKGYADSTLMKKFKKWIEEADEIEKENDIC